MKESETKRKKNMTAVLNFWEKKLFELNWIEFKI